MGVLLYNKRMSYKYRIALVAEISSDDPDIKSVLKTLKIGGEGITVDKIEQMDIEEVGYKKIDILDIEF